MKKDIIIPTVEGVYIAIVQELNPKVNKMEWIAYIVNDLDTDLEMVNIVSEGYDENIRTTKLRHGMPFIPQKSYAKIELMMEDMFALNNKFSVTYFLGNKLYDKNYVFEKESIKLDAINAIPLMDMKGVLSK